MKILDLCSLVCSKFVLLTARKTADGVCVAAALLVLLLTQVAVAETVVVDFDPVDASDEIEAAIDQAGPGGTVILPNVGETWFVRDGRRFNSAIVLDEPGLRFVLEEGVVLQASPEPDAFTELTDRVISVAADGVVIVGRGCGATILGNRGSYVIEDPFDNHARHAIRVGGYDGVVIRNLRILNSGGDGIQVGGYYSDNQPSNLLILDCFIDGSTRNGISLTSGDSVRIRRCVLSNSAGAWPQAGIDFEIDKGRPESVLQDVVATDCVAFGNAGSGLMFGLFNYFDAEGVEAQDIDIKVKRCSSIDSGLYGIKLSAVRIEQIPGSPQGLIDFQDVSVDGSDGHGVQVSGFISEVTPSVRFEGLTVKNAATGAGQEVPQYPIFYKGARRGYKIGATKFLGCKVTDTVDRPIIYSDENSRNATVRNGKGFKDITGTIQVDSPSETFFELGFPEFQENVTVLRENAKSN